MKTDDLINLMVEDAPVHDRPVRSLALAIAAGIVISGALFFAMIGTRHDIAGAAETYRFLLKFVVTLTLAITAIALVLRIGRPGVSVKGQALALILVPVVLGAAVISEMMTVPQGEWRTKLIGTNAIHCLTVIPLLAIGPLVLMIWAMRKGAPENPGRAGMVAGLVSSGIAATFYASNCTDDSPFFVAFWYTLSVTMVTLAGYLIGRQALRW